MGIGETVAAIGAAVSWDARVALIRQIPEQYGTAQHQEIYAKVASDLYVDSFDPDFAYIPWRDDYEVGPFLAAYGMAAAATNDFEQHDVPTIYGVLVEAPETLRVFRTIVGLTRPELAAASVLVSGGPVTDSAVSRMEAGGRPRDPEETASVLARLIVGLVDGSIFDAPPPGTRSKIDKPDTLMGWDSVAGYAEDGVPLGVFLHQRHYGGAFRQLLDATSSIRGDVIEDAVEALVSEAGVPFIRTGSHNQGDIEKRFNLTVRPAPDFVFYDNAGALRGLLECKGANDGGTARDKARRFDALRQESIRLGGVPLFAVLSGLGWRRTNDALGPVLRDCDGRVFTTATLPEMLAVSPFPQLVGTAAEEEPES